MNVRDTLLRLVRVPHAPEHPPGSPPRVFRAAENFFYLRVIQWVVGHFFFAAMVITAAVTIEALIGANRPPAPIIILLRFIEIALVTFFICEFVFSAAVLRLDFELRWYMLSDRAIRIREGILTVREKTMALANVQNISVRQGPLQRLLGIADVEVMTAGGGTAAKGDGRKGQVGEPLHVAYFRGVGNAEEIRDLVREGVRRQKDSGLGDPEERRVAAERKNVTSPEAVMELLREAQALRAVVDAATSAAARR